MALTFTLQNYRSTTPNAVPTLADGQLGVNMVDRKLYYGYGGTSYLLCNGNTTSTVSSTPPSSPVAGSQWVDSASNLAYTYDATRSAWLGNAITCVWTYSGATKGAYLKNQNLNFTGNGYTFPWKVMLVGMSVAIRTGDLTHSFLVKVDLATQYTATLNNSLTGAWTNLSLPIVVGSTVSVYIDSSGSNTYDTMAMVIARIQY